MTRIIAGGTGFIGQSLVKQWLGRGIDVAIIGRNKDRIRDLYGDTVTGYDWQDFAEHHVSILHGAEMVLNLVGCNIGAKRWSNARKQEILDSRINATKTICDACIALADHSPPLFNASAIGTYGLQETPATGMSDAMDENTVIDFNAKPDFLSEVGRAWEAATNEAKAHGVHVVNCRFGVVLGAGGGVLEKLLPIFKMGMGGPIGSGRQAFTWVHIDDIAKAIEFLLVRPDITGPVNMVAPGAVSQAQFAKQLANTLNRPCFMPTPALMLKLIYGQMAEELLLQGQHIKPTRLLENNYEFAFADLDSALENILAPQS